MSWNWTNSVLNIKWAFPEKKCYTIHLMSNYGSASLELAESWNFSSKRPAKPNGKHVLGEESIWYLVSYQSTLAEKRRNEYRP